MTAPPLLFTFGLHLHQPVGNFDSVFEQHLTDVYRPLVAALDHDDTWPVTLHLSGPLLDWLETHAADYLDQLGRHVSAGRVELLLAGYDEPILAVLSRDDRLEQIGRMREALARRFGAQATGLWLTERVWEPDLAEDLARAGVRYVLVDDRHFLVAGYEREALHRPFWTESGGHSIAVFPIDERLRYLVPFRPPAELAGYFRSLRAAGAPVAVLADDGEKFGGWPGTLDWVYTRGWMREFTAMLADLRTNGEIRLATFSEALAATVPAGPAYLPSASYREMEGWALPTRSALRLAELERSLGKPRIDGPDGALIRGTHWRNFLVKYPESNRMHKKMVALSRLCRERGDPTAARRAIGKAQCNDAYWHGVFGGLYLPHLRDGVWRELARAEAALRIGEALTAERIDLDCDGAMEVWVHGGELSALVAPSRGGSVEEWTVFRTGRNLANTLTRRREAYHEEALQRAARLAAAHPAEASGGTASIHDLEASLVLGELPPFDPHPRAIFQEQLLGAIGNAADLANARADIAIDWRAAPALVEVDQIGDRLRVTAALSGLRKELTFGQDGQLDAAFEWSPVEGADWFVTELSLAGDATVTSDATAEWRYPIETIAKSERGFDRTVQGTAITLGWPAGKGSGRVRVRV